MDDDNEGTAMSQYKRLVLTAVIGSTLIAADAPGAREWQILTQAIGNGGVQASVVRMMLGTIDSPESRALVGSILNSEDTRAISETVAGLNSAQCVSYLADLAGLAKDPRIPLKGNILTAIARAGTGEAAGILAEIADTNETLLAGMALGSLESMGQVSKPALIRVATHAQFASARETAIYILRRMNAREAIAAFRAALLDQNEKVRIAGALGLARFGIAEGKHELELAASASVNGNQLEEALVALATLGNSDAYEKLRMLVTSADRGVRVDTTWAMARSENVSIKNFAYQLELERQPILNTMLAERLFDPNDPRDMLSLQAMAQDRDEMTQLTAARVFLRNGYLREGEPILERALASENEGVRNLAITTASNDSAVQSMLSRQLTSRYPAVQAAALSAISRLGDRGRFAEAATYLASQDRSVSEAAAKTLLTLDPTKARVIFEQGIESKSTFARIHSAAMLLSRAGRARE